MAYLPPLNGGRLNASIGGNSTSAGAGYSYMSTGNMILAGGSNITLSQNGNTVSIVGGVAGGSINFSASNTSANLASVTFSNSNGVGFGLSNGVITASHNGITSQSNQTLGIKVTGNTIQSNTGTVDARNMTFNGLGNVSVGYSNGSVQISGAGGGGGVALYDGARSISSGTASIAAAGALTASITNQTLSLSVPAVSSLSATGAFSISTNGTVISMGVPAFSAGISGTNTSGNAGSATNQVIFAGGNNITLSQSTGVGGNTISIIGGAGGGGGGVALYDGANSISSGTASLAAGGALTASIDGQTLSLSAPATSMLVGTNGISLSSNGGTVSIDGAGAGGATGMYFDNLIQQVSQPAIAWTAVTGGASGVINRLLVQPLDPSNELFPFYITGSTMMLNFSNSLATTNASASAAHSSTYYIGIYSRVNSTQLSMVNSASVSYGMSANTGNSASYAGARWLSINSSAFSTQLALSQNVRYYFGLLARSAGATYTAQSIGGMLYGNSAQRSGFMGAGASSNTSYNAWLPFMGVHSVTTFTAPPASIANSDINKATSFANFIPQIVINGGAAQIN